MALAGKVCLVTGASRGIGKGIALQLGEAGATVYITGRSLRSSSGARGTLLETAEEIEGRGGKCIPVQCDHSNDEDIEKLFKQIENEQDGRLDLLVNNAYSAVQAIMDNSGIKFWDQPLSMWDTVNVVGLRNHYICTVYAAKIMVPRKSGLIVNVSSAGGLRYLFNIPYGIGKEAVDRMAADCAIELRKSKVAMVSLWPGAVQTEIITDIIEKGTGLNEGQASGDGDPNDASINPRDLNRMKKTFQDGETIEYAGKAITGLMQDKNMMKKTGRILITGDLADEYGFKDVNGAVPPNLRSFGDLLRYGGYYKLAAMFPRWVKVPGWMISLGGNKL